MTGLHDLELDYVVYLKYDYYENCKIYSESHF